jgi:starch-binding outer membrane protein, SusD/RagB family
MKNTILKSVLLGTVLSVSSCTTSFLDSVQPYALITKENFYRNETEIRQAVVGLYGTLRGRYTNYFLLTEVPSDNSTWGTSAAILSTEFDNLAWLTTNATLSDTWIGHYQTIANANIVLGRIGGVPMDAAQRNRLAGEARFIRALMYFNLVRFFGDVPLITTELNSPGEALTFLRRPAAEVYAQIEADLREAIPGLPARYTVATDISRATSGAARALLGKALLQQRKWAEARTVLQEVVTNEAAGGYSLLPNYRDVFLQDNNAEVVFSVQYEVDNGNGSNFPQQFLPSSSGTKIYGVAIQKRDFNLGTRDLFNAFETGDTRKPIAIDVFSDAPNDYFTRKFADPALNQTTGTDNSDVDWPVIRYADVLLMLAEAQNEAGATAEALGPLNRVRVRAGLPALTGLSQAQARDRILQERRVELCFEGHRWPDLIRADRAVSTMQAFRTAYNPAIVTDANKQLFPIPQRERNINAQLTQNPGY